MVRFLGKLPYHNIVAVILIIILAVLVVVSIPSIVIVLVEELTSEPVWIMDVEKIRTVLDLTIWVLIIIELIDSIKVYLEQHALHLEAILSISLIAMARKIIAVRLRDYEPVMVLGMAALVIALGTTYYFVRRAHSLPRVDSHDADKNK